MRNERGQTERMNWEPKMFGAKGDGRTKDTKAVQAAIDTAAQRGGRVLLSGGTYLCGTLYLKSNVTMEIDLGAILKASGEIEDYGTDTHHNRYRNEPELDRCFLYAQDAENIELCGKGMIDGNAAAFPNEGSIQRPMLLRLLRCSHVRLHGLRLYHAAAWTTAFLDSSYLWATDLDIFNHTNFNGDGLDFDGCHHIWVRGCRIAGTDDNLCLQSSGMPVYDVHISDCNFSSVCAGIRIGLKSIGTISDIVISNCTMRNIWREGIKLECSEGGSITDVLVSNITMHNVRRPVFALLNNRYAPDNLGSSLELERLPTIGTMERLRFVGITVVDDDTMMETQYRFGKDKMGGPDFGGIRFDANCEHPIRDVTIDGLWYTAAGGVNAECLSEAYPGVPDRLLTPDIPGSENYWPDWSRATHLDARNIDGLLLRDIRCKTLLTDSRPGVLIEQCRMEKPESWRMDTL